MLCDLGYDVEFFVVECYVCYDDGIWIVELLFVGIKWLSCKYYV